MVLSLIGPIDCHLVQRVLFVSAYAGIQLKLVSITEGDENESEAYRLNCHPLNRFPVMKTDEGYLIESNAMIRFLARTEVLMSVSDAEQVGHVPHPQYPIPYALYGHSDAESGEVDSWLDYVARRIDANVHPFSHFDKSGGAEPGKEVRDRLWVALEGLEKRLEFLRNTRKELVKQAGGVLTARTGRAAMDIDEDFLYSEGNSMLSSARDRRVSTIYNVAGSIRNRQDAQDRDEKGRQIDAIRRTTAELLDGASSELQQASSTRRQTSAPTDSAVSPRQSSALSPRLSTMMLSTRGGAMAGGIGGNTPIQRQDLFFLVGDSLTAADIVVVMALHNVYVTSALGMSAVEEFPTCYKFYKAVMMLPVATNMRKALSISMV